jgi:hypothetical protein
MKVRFHLAKGKNFKKWQITDDDGIKSYFDPMDVKLTLHNCVLCNSKKTANRIYKGGSKTVCSWIKCEWVKIESATDISGKCIFYNPRVNPYWYDEEGTDIDGEHYDTLKTNGKNVFVNY